MMMVRTFLISFVFHFFLAGCGSLPDNTDRVESFAFSDTQDTSLGRYVERQKEYAGTHEDGFVLLKSGLDAFVARAALAEKAERSLDVQYYLYREGMIGNLFSGALWKAAERGVRVRLLVDDMSMPGRDDDVIAFDQHPNIEVRIFNPFNRNIARGVQYVTGLGSLTRRMHNKSFTADNAVTIVGGRNIGDEYYEADPELEFTDLDVLAIGKVVHEVSDSFDLYWNSSLAYPVRTFIKARPSEEEIREMKERFLSDYNDNKSSSYAAALDNSKLAQQIRNSAINFHWSDAVVLVDHPEKITSSRDANELHLVTQLIPYFRSVEQELIIITPYFVPGTEGVNFFKKLIDRGVRVKVLTNSLASNDVLIAHAGYSNYRRALLRYGVELYEMDKKLTRAQRKQGKGFGGSSKASLHSKTFVLDRNKIFIGSLNLDPRSFYENSEIGLVLNSREISERIARVYVDEIAKNAFRLELARDDDGDEYILWHGYKDGEPVTFDVDPYTSFWLRLGAGLLSLLPVESQL
jgi:putative cardiolipin synthase